MSKSKSKSSTAAVKSSDPLTKVKDAAIIKPVKALKAVAQATVKEEKKSKKKVKEPTPEPSESEDEESDESASSEEDSESEDETPASNGKTNGATLKGAAQDSSDAESDSSESSDDEAPTNGVAKASAATSESEEEDDDEEDSNESEEDESDEETVVEKTNKTKLPVNPNNKPAIAKVGDSDDESAEEDDDSEKESEAESSSDDSDDEEEVETKPVQAAKRKAEETESPFAKKTKLAEAHGESKGNNLFVGNLSWNVDEAWLTSEFESFGELSGVRIITDRDSGRSKGFGYVEFVNAEDAAKAYDEMKGHELDGRAINVDFAVQRTQGNGQDRAQNRAKSFGDTTSPPSDTLFVGNLSFDVGQDTVSEAFGEYGTIMGVRLPTDRETGQPKGFGYVTFSSVEEAKGAFEAMQGYELEGRTVRLDYSQPRPQNGDSPGRGRGGFGGRGRGGFGDRGGRGGGRGRGGFGDRGGRGGRGGFGGRGGSTNRGGFGDYKGKKTTF